MTTDELKERWRSWLHLYRSASVGTRTAMAALIREEAERSGDEYAHHYGLGVADLMLPEE